MSSQPNHSNPSHPPPLPHPAYHRPPQSGWQPNGGGSPFVHRSTPQHVDPYTRIAVLEKEVEHYKVEKATAELAVQYLANLSAKGERCGNGDEQLAKLTSELTRANEDNLVLKAKLENTQSIIITLLTCGKLESLNHSPKSDQKSQQPSISVETVDLIDLVDTVKSSDCGKGVQDDTTLLDTSHDDFSDLEDAVPSAVVVKQQDQPESIAFPDSQYIHHFTQRKCEILDTAGNVIGLEASLKVKALERSRRSCIADGFRFPPIFNAVLWSPILLGINVPRLRLSPTPVTLHNTTQTLRLQYPLLPLIRTSYLKMK